MKILVSLLDKLTFKHLNIVDRCMNNDTRRIIAKTQESLKEFLDDMSIGNIMKADIPQGIWDRLKEMVNE